MKEFEFNKGEKFFGYFDEKPKDLRIEILIMFINENKLHGYYFTRAEAGAYLINILKSFTITMGLELTHNWSKDHVPGNFSSSQ